MLSTALFCQCNNPETSSKVGFERMFDMPTFFKAEIARLTSENPEIEKTVYKGEERESKTMFIQDWSRELSSFVAIDLNKPAYQGYIEKDSTDHQVVLRVQNSDLDIAEVMIHYNERNEPDEIRVIRHIQNFLYTTEEELSYRKNKGYTILKKQDVWGLGSNRYHIEGIF